MLWGGRGNSVPVQRCLEKPGSQGPRTAPYPPPMPLRRCAAATRPKAGLQGAQEKAAARAPAGRRYLLPSRGLNLMRAVQIYTVVRPPQPFSMGAGRVSCAWKEARGKARPQGRQCVGKVTKLWWHLHHLTIFHLAFLQLNACMLRAHGPAGYLATSYMY